jgi:hypothetical protein
MDPVRELKVRAEILHHAVQRSEDPALERLRILAEFRNSDSDALRKAADRIQRKHCLAAVARELGFLGFDHARRIFEGDASEVDFGTLLYGADRGGHLNHWFATYEEARAFHAGSSSIGGRLYLLAYKTQFFVTDADFIRTLGLDPDDADWPSLGWDWARPQSRDARKRLYGRLLASRRSPSA